MEEIKVREFVRTKNGLIGKVNKIELAGRGVRFGGEYLSDTIIQFNDGKIYERRVEDKNITKHSKNIIDLIELGDYVNGKEVYSEDGKLAIELAEHMPPYELLEDMEIKSILTHEQYEQNCYTVERKER